MVRPRITFLLFLILAGGLRASPNGDILKVFQTSCVKCHGKDDKVKGKVNLLEIHSLDALKKNPQLLGKIVEAIDFEEMPPEDEPQLAPETRKDLLTSLEDLLAEVDGCEMPGLDAMAAKIATGIEKAKLVQRAMKPFA